MVNIHKLKEKRKNILRQLKEHYKKVHHLKELIKELENAKFNIKILMENIKNEKRKN